MLVRLTDMIAGGIIRALMLLDTILFHILVCYYNGRKLFSLLLRGTRTWVVMLARLIAFTMLLGTGWYRLLKYWFFSPLIIRNLEYGRGAKYRNMMDIYLPQPFNPEANAMLGDARSKKRKRKEKQKQKPLFDEGPAPVVIFVSGGAWMIGYKLWSALVARGLAAMGILTIVPDYRNFPQGNINHMMDDISMVVEWTAHNAHRFGGDPEKIVLAGQSAGAHITLCLLVADYLKEQQRQKRKQSTSENLPAVQEDDVSKNEEPSGTSISCVETVISTAPTLKLEMEESMENISPLSTNVTKDDSKSNPSISKCSSQSDTDTEKINDLQGIQDRESAELFIDSSPYLLRGRRSPSNSAVLSQSKQHQKKTYLSRAVAPVTKHLRKTHNGSSTRYASEQIIPTIDGKVSADEVESHDDQDSIDNKEEKKEEDSEVWREVEPNSFSGEITAKFVERDDPKKLISSEESNQYSEALDGKESLVMPFDQDLSSMELLCGALLSTDPGETFSKSCKEEIDCSECSNDEYESDSDCDSADGSTQQRRDRSSSIINQCGRSFSILPHIKLFIGVSGPYNLSALEEHLHGRGLDASILKWICRGDISSYSPTTLLTNYIAWSATTSDPCTAAAVAAPTASSLPLNIPTFDTMAETAANVVSEVTHGHQTNEIQSHSLQDFPPVALFHGTRDASIPVSICTELAQVLYSGGARVICKIYEGWNHTDAILEGPLSGSTRLFEDIAVAVGTYTNNRRKDDACYVPTATRVSSNRLAVPSTANIPPTIVPDTAEHNGALIYETVRMDYSPVLGSNLFGYSQDTRKKISHGKVKNKRHFDIFTNRTQIDLLSIEPMVSPFLVKVAREINPF